MSSGVPQASVLGPLLFLMFINDLPEVLKYCSCWVFADDVQLYSIDSLSDIHSMKVQAKQDIDAIVAWPKLNKININPNRTFKTLLFNGSSS